MGADMAMESITLIEPPGLCAPDLGIHQGVISNTTPLLELPPDSVVP